MFKYQVLKNYRPGKVNWGVYRPHINFHLRLQELNEITYAEESNKIVVATRKISSIKYRGRILLSFKRS